MDIYKKIDLYKLYFTVFPNLTADVFCYFSIIAMIILIIYSIIRFCHEDTPNEGFDPCAVLCAKSMIIIPYLIIFIGYFIYIIYEYIKIYKNRKPKNLKKVKADMFLQNSLEEIYNRNLNEDFIIAFIVLFVCSMIIFLLAWILSWIFTKRYLELLKNVK